MNNPADAVGRSMERALIDNIADLTAVRDTEHLEFSLLKSLHQLLRPQDLILYKRHNDGHLLAEVRYTEDGGDVQIDGLTLPDIILEADFSASGQYTVEQNDAELNLFSLFESRFYQVYLLVKTGQTLSEYHSDLITGLMDIYSNFCNLLEDAQKDQLTGLANRNSFDKYVKKIYQQVSQYGDLKAGTDTAVNAPVYWMALLDIDHFKNINDSFGHLYGDEVLVLLAQTMQNKLRRNDMLFRYGGEEFVLVAECSDEKAARHMFERLRYAIECKDFPQLGQVTVSIGVTRISPQIMPVTLLEYADRALYHSKDHGRNRVTFYADMQASDCPAVTGGDVELF